MKVNIKKITSDYCRTEPHENILFDGHINKLFFDFNNKHSITDFYDLSKLDNYASKCNNDVEIILLSYYPDEISEESSIKIIKALKHLLTQLSNNSLVNNVTIIVNADDYEHSYDQIISNIYVEPVGYRGTDVKRVLLKCKGIKLFGIRYSYFILRVLNILRRIKKSI
ncbi:TPA: hypothetical protein ACF7ZB_001789 [Kluyvera georgiana]